VTHVPRWQIVVAAIAVVFAVVYSAPNFLSSTVSWLPGNPVRLGLDLQGGSHLLLRVDSDVVLSERLESVLDEIRTRFRAAGIGYTGIGVEQLAGGLTLTDPAQAEQALELAEEADETLDIEVDGNGRLTFRLDADAEKELRISALSQSQEVIRRRIDETGTNEPTIQRQGDDRILVQLPGVDDPERVKRLLGQTAKMNFRMVDETASIPEAIAGRVPPGSELLYEDDGTEQGIPIVVRRRVGVSGDNLVGAAPVIDQNNQPVVTIRFDAAGARRFGDLTTENVGRRFAIVLDGRVISAPVIREPIPGGSGQISGNFTFETASDLALLLRAGALPAPLVILEERTVGPSLGRDSIAAGTLAGQVALLLVIVYMIAVYGLFGVAADIALAVNIALLLGILSALGATLTLPGIAGIALTIGMAVDANVLIFERIREETRRGRSPVSAIDTGYRQALRAIIDANVTTLIAALVLFQMGSGPIRGFAVTLAVGVFTTMFCSLIISRLLVLTWLSRARPKVLNV
jgi:preprotein translocase subunit SecD